MTARLFLGDCSAIDTGPVELRTPVKAEQGNIATSLPEDQVIWIICYRGELAELIGRRKGGLSGEEEGTAHRGVGTR